MVRQWQELFYKQRFSFTNLSNNKDDNSKKVHPDLKKLTYIPDFVKIAEAYGLKAIRIYKNEEVAGALKKALDSEKTFLIEAMISPGEKVFPMVPAGASLDETIVDMA